MNVYSARQKRNITGVVSPVLLKSVKEDVSAESLDTSAKTN